MLKAYRDSAPIDSSSIQARSEIVKLPTVPTSSEQARKAREVVQRFATREQAPFLETVAAFKSLDIEARGGKPIEVEVQVITLGKDIAFVSLPGEIFVELGLAIKKASPFKHTFIAELANGSIGYIPDRAAYSEGNYEVISARCAEGSGEMLVDSAVKMLRALFAARPANP